MSESCYTEVSNELDPKGDWDWHLDTSALGLNRDEARSFARRLATVHRHVRLRIVVTTYEKVS